MRHSHLRGPPALAAGNGAADRVTLAGGERPLGDVVSLPTTVPNRESFNKVWAWIARLPEQYHAIVWRMASAVLVQMDGFYNRRLAPHWTSAGCKSLGRFADAFRGRYDREAH
jgi:hypothetical protein